MLPVQAGDALFVHAHSQNVPQQVGAVVVLNGHGADLAALRASIARAAGQTPHLRRRLAAEPGRLGRDRWVVDESVDVCSRITQVTLGAGGSPAALGETVGAVRWPRAASQPSGRSGL
jgi:hypothetical protein